MEIASPKNDFTRIREYIMTPEDMEEAIERVIGPERYLNYLLRKSIAKAPLSNPEPSLTVTRANDEDEDIFAFDIKREDELLERWGLRPHWLNKNNGKK